MEAADSWAARDSNPLILKETAPAWCADLGPEAHIPQKPSKSQHFFILILIEHLSLDLNHKSRIYRMWVHYRDALVRTTRVVNVTSLLSGFGSAVALVARAVMSKRPCRKDLTRILKVWTASGVNAFCEQVTVPLA